MTVVSHLAKHLLYLKPEKDPARLSFYHFLIHLCDSEQKLSSELIDQFVLRAMSFEHWQNHRPYLHQEIENALQSYHETHQIDLISGMKRWPRSMQVVRLENLEHLGKIIERDLERVSSLYTRSRVVVEDDDRAIAILVTPEGGVEIRIFSPLCFVEDGELRPLEQDLGLSYDSQLNFKPHALQHLSVDSHTTARFRFSSEGCAGKFVRGYTFQKSAVLDGGKLNRFPSLFYPIKRIEQLFINRKTDPMYIELVQILEKAVDLVRQNHPEAQTFARAAFERGKLALEQIFPDDNLVRLLINTLEVVVRQDTAPVRNEPRLWEEL